MEFISAGVAVAVAAVAFKLPFLRFPMDEDFSFYTYVSHFRGRGIRLKKDFMALLPAWRVHLISLVYGDTPAGGIFRVRLALAAAHAATSVIVFWAAYGLTHGIGAALIAGMLYAFFATVPSLSVHTINMEQIYTALVISGLVFLMDGNHVEAGLLFGLAVIPKITSGLYVPPLALAVWYGHGFAAGLLFCAVAALPPAVSYAADFLGGYNDAESRRQIATRFAVGVRLGKLKGMYGSVSADIRALVADTLPVWIIGVPALFFIPFHEQRLYLALFLAVTVAMIYFQMAFSRYHYLPLVGILCIASGAGLGAAGGLKTGAIAAMAVTAAFTARRLWPYYRRPAHHQSLAKYEKFDQYIYIPRLGKALGRLMRMKKETGRIFVWGNYTQLYQYANAPAADAFVHYAIGPWDDEPMAGYFDSVIGGLMAHRPRYVIKTFRDFDMAMLERITGLKYGLVKVAYCRFAVYRLVSANPPPVDPLTLDWRKKLELCAELTRGEHSPGIDPADLETGNRRRAMKECKKLVRLNPLDAEGLFFLDRLCEQAGTDGGLEPLFDGLLREMPELNTVRLAMAKRRMRENNLAEAESLIAREERRFGVSPASRFMSGLLLRAKGDAKNAASLFEKLFAENPENGEYAYYLAECLRESGQTQKAKGMYDTAWRKSGGKGREWIRTKIAVRTAEMNAAMVPEHETLEKFIGMDTENESLAYARASALERAGMRDAAYGAFQTVATRGDDDAMRGAALFRLARLAPNGGKGTFLRQCLKLVPDHRGAKNLLDAEKKIG